MDGMDLAICRISVNGEKYDDLIFAGAKRPILFYKLKNSIIEKIDGDNKSIGSAKPTNNEKFTDKTIPIEKGDMIFMFTDGIIDQPNHERMRFGTNKFLNIINDNIKEPMINITASLETAFDLYKGMEDQRDDVTVLGIRLK